VSKSTEFGEVQLVKKPLQIIPSTVSLKDNDEYAPLVEMYDRMIQDPKNRMLFMEVMAVIVSREYTNCPKTKRMLKSKLLLACL
jgi:hypothetical protein